jgi:uncharacterized membrane protein
MYAPPQPWDRRLVAGAALAFTGFLLQGLGWLSYLLTWNWGLNLFVFILLGVGSILAGVGFLLAFLGLARSRA